MNDVVILAVTYLAVFLSGPVTAIVHEMGHAIAFLTLTKPQRIDIYIGSYGGTGKHYRFRAGKIRFHIKRTFPFVKGIGLCRSSAPERNYVNDVIISLAGPVVTFITAVIFSLLALTLHSGVLVTIVCAIFLGYALLSLLINLIPNEIPLRGDEMIDNDGRHILFALQLKKARPAYLDALDLDRKDPGAAVMKLQEVLAAVPKNARVIRILISTLLTAGNYEDGLAWSANLEKLVKLTDKDILTRGILHSFAKNSSDAINTYNDVLRRDRKNVAALNNIGFELIKKGEYPVAEHALLRAIEIKPGFDNAWCNLGELYITQNKLEEGKARIDECLALNSSNADAYKNLGWYYLKLNNAELAKLNFEKAVELDKDIDLSSFDPESRSPAKEELAYK